MTYLNDDEATALRPYTIDAIGLPDWAVDELRNLLALNVMHFTPRLADYLGREPNGVEMVALVKALVEWLNREKVPALRARAAAGTVH